MAREMIAQCIEGVKEGKDPIGVLRDPSRNEILTFDASMQEMEALT